MNNNGPIPDILAVVVAIAALIFSQEVAHMVGPYLLIIMASAIGASWTVKRQDMTSRAGAMWYFAKVCGAAVLLTGFLSALISGFHADLTERSLLVPVAFGLGAVGSDWKPVILWAARKIGQMVDIFIKLRGGGGGGS